MFAILRSEEAVTLSDQIDFRLMRNTNNCVLIYAYRKCYTKLGPIISAFWTDTRPLYASCSSNSLEKVP